ncbi:MAG: CDP-glycerol glycerophosphotransferase family protein [Lachnospiraceae bacterium]|nr:CDP-glycerol glycerophosphotransferase family protein [Lachnospiraceae bacterium]
MVRSTLLLYIDPGTGAMLFTALIGLITTASFAIRKLGIKIKFMLSGGKVEVQREADKPDIIVFSDHKRYWNVFKPICDELERRKIDSCYYTASSDDPALSEKYSHVHCCFIGEGNRAYAHLNMMSAQICLSTTPGLDVYQWKRSKDTNYYVHIPHSVGTLTMYRMFGLDFYDSVLLNGDFQERTLRKLETIRGIRAKELHTVGCIYFDAMRERLKSARTTCKTDSEKITVLLAPSWGPNAILTKYGEDFLDALVETGFNIIIRPHPQSKTSENKMLDSLERKFPESDKWHWNNDNDNFDVLREADVMISDFSGVIYDYALVFDGAVIYTEVEFDTSVYDASWLDEPIWAEEILPKIGRKLEKKDIKNIKAIIMDAINRTEFNEARDEIREIVWMHKGEAAVRTVDYLNAKLVEIKTLKGDGQI